VGASSSQIRLLLVEAVAVRLQGYKEVTQIAVSLLQAQTVPVAATR